jgi:hypothetical protein
MNLESIIEKCKAGVTKHPLHHLEKIYRNELFSAINDINISLRLLFNTAIKVSAIYTEAYPENNKVFNLLTQIKRYIDTDAEKKVLLSNAKSTHTYMDNLLSGNHYNAVYAGYAAVVCSYETTNKKIVYAGTDEFDDEPDNWSSCFYASLAWNNGASNLADIQPDKNKEFWYWFLNEGLKLAQNHKYLTIKRPVISATTEKDIPQRKQPALADNDSELKLLTKQINDFFKQLVNKEAWSEFKLEGYYVANNRSQVGYYKAKTGSGFEKLDNTQLYLLGKEINLVKTLGDIRDKMYNLLPAEGAWYSVIINFYPDKQSEYHFIYDEKAGFFDKWVSESAFADDYLAHTRQEEYTPLWLEKIVGKS